MKTGIIRALAAQAAALGLTGTVWAETWTYKVDFGTDSSPVASGYQAAEAKTLAATPDLELGLKDGSGGHPIDLQFHGDVGGFSLGDAAKPLTTDGIYTFGSTGNDPKEIPFTISGLPAHALVTMYAVRAWNGAERAGFVSLGESGMIDIAGAPDEMPDPASFSDFVVVAQRQKVGADGKIGGVFSNSDGSTMRPEGQWGAMVLVVEAP